MIWALVTAVVYGGADFAGGMATKQRSAAVVMLWAHAMGLVGILLVALAMADAFSWRDMALGAMGGFCGLLGVLLLYRRLAVGPMHVVAPLSALAAAVVPAVWGLITGDRLSGLAWVGVVVALVAIVLVSSASDESGDQPVTPRVVGEALLSGVGFGGFFIFLDATADATAPWPIVGSRMLTVSLLVVFLFARRSPVRLSGGPSLWWLVAAAGLGDTAANATFLLATQTTDLTIAGVVTGLYPVSTVVLARVVLGERFRGSQLLGFVAALAGASLIAAG